MKTPKDMAVKGKQTVNRPERNTGDGVWKNAER